jgi:hypothetical protein
MTCRVQAIARFIYWGAGRDSRVSTAFECPRGVRKRLPASEYQSIGELLTAFGSIIV